MDVFMDFILVDGNVLSFANVVSFMAFTVVMGSIVMICQALMRPTVYR